MFYFVTNDHKTITKCMWGSGPAVRSTVGSWQSLRGDLRCKDPEKF